jgi:LacI family transcriptional regulator
VKNASGTTLREISELTGVSRMAVSLALRGKNGVSEATRRKVHQAAKKLGYEPDPEVAKLMSRIRSRQSQDTQSCIALLTSGHSSDDWKHFTTEKKYVQGAVERARKYGYRMEPFWIDDPEVTPDRLSRILWSRGIEGVIIAPLMRRLVEGVSREIELDFTLFSMVEISETIESPELDRAIHDQYTSMIRVLDELNDLGYQRPGLVIEDALDLRVNGKWTAAYLYVKRRRKYLLPPLVTEGRTQTAFNRWYKKYQPDVVISVDRLGFDFIQKAGLDIPKNVSYATLDLDSRNLDSSRIAGIDQNSRRVGAAAVDMLVAAIQRGHRGIPDHPTRMEIEGTWKPGGSAPKQ